MAFESFAPLGGARAARSAGLTPAEQESLVASLGRKALTGLGYVGDVLDTPGSILRGALAGRNPLEGVFNPEKRIGGRELLEQAGLLSRNKPGFDAGDVAGFAAEVALDPLSYIGLGGLSKAGKVAKNAGLPGKTTRAQRMTSTLDDLLKANPSKAQAVADAAKGNLAGLRTQKLGGLVSTPLGVIGTGPTAQKIAGKLGSAGDALRYSAPGRLVNSLFNPAVQGATTKLGQQTAAKITADLAEEEIKNKGVTGRLADLVRQEGWDKAGADQKLRELVENPRLITSPRQQEIHDIARQALDTQLVRKQASSLRAPTLQDKFTKYFPRAMSIAPNPQEGVAQAYNTDRALMGGKHAAQKTRIDAFRDIPGGTATIQKIAADPGVNRLLEIHNQFGEKALPINDIGYHIARAFPGVFTGKGAASKANRLAMTLREIFPDVRKAGVFANAPLADLDRHLVQTSRAIVNEKHVAELLRQPGVLADPGSARHLPGMQPVSELLERLGMDHTALADPKMMDWRIDRGVANDLAKAFERTDFPKAVGAVMKGYDSFTNLTKAALTGVWPAFHVRNFTSGMVQNALMGAFSPGDTQQVYRMLQGKNIAGIARVPAIERELSKRGLSGDAAGTDLFRQMLRSHGLVGKWQGEAATNIIHPTAGSMLKAKTAADVAAEFPGGLGGTSPVTPASIGKKAIAMAPNTSVNPLEIPGFGERGTKKVFGPAAAGQDLSFLVESLNRGSPMLTMLRQGIDPVEAAKRINAAHVSYANKSFTVAEREYLQRIWPFFKFQSRQMAHVLKELAANPGGKMAQTIRAENMGRERDALLPENLTAEAAVPIGKDGSGNPIYLSQLGLMHNDPIQFFGNPIPGRGGLQAAGLELLGRTNPIIKGALEAATGQSLYQRSALGPRALEDLDPVLGRIVANLTGRKQATEITGERVLDPLLTNSPLSRALSATAKVTNPETPAAAKIANLLTGLRTTTLRPAAADAILRDRMNAGIRDLPNSRQFQDVYVPKDLIEKMPEGAQKEYARRRAVLSQLDRQARQRAKERQAKVQAAGAL